MTIQEFLGAADYLVKYGAKEVILCERGIKTFETSTRNTMDLAVIPIAKQAGYKIIADPSHGTGRRDLVLPMARAAVAAGADGLIVECTKEPDKAITDGFQTIDYDELFELKTQFDILKKI